MGTTYRRKWKDRKTCEACKHKKCKTLKGEARISYENENCKIHEGEVWWIKYYRHGKPYRESSKSEKITDAQRLLKKREGEIAEGKIPGVYFDKVTFNALAKDLLTDYEINERDTLKRAKWSVGCLKKSFQGIRATDITTDRIQAHIEKRMKKGLSNASVNRELAVLKRMFSLGAKSTPSKVNLIPYIPMLKESNTRKGFFELGEYLALKSTLPRYLKPVASFAYHTGWRPGEILNLTWDKVDLKQGIIGLDPGEIKNEKARTIYLNEELIKEIKPFTLTDAWVALTFSITTGRRSRE